MVDVKLIWLFLIGMFLAFLFYLEEIITNNEVIEKYGLAKVSVLIFINSIIGGWVAVTVYYILVQFVPSWHDFLKIGVASSTAMLGKNMVHIYHQFLKARIQGGGK